MHGSGSTLQNSARSFCSDAIIYIDTVVWSKTNKLKSMAHNLIMIYMSLPGNDQVFIGIK